MPKTVADSAKAFTRLSERIDKMWTPHYPKEATLRKSVGWQATALTPLDAINMAVDIANRILALAEDGKPSEVSISDYYGSYADQADEMDFANARPSKCDSFNL